MHQTGSQKESLGKHEEATNSRNRMA